MRKVDYQQITGLLNKYRLEHQSRTYTYKEIDEVLGQLGFNRQVRTKLLAKGLIPFEKVGKSHLYSFGKEPIHKSQIEALYQSANEKNKKYHQKQEVITSEATAIQQLQASGYRVQRLVGFDLEKFKAENPVLYKRYLKYETV